LNEETNSRKAIAIIIYMGSAGAVWWQFSAEVALLSSVVCWGCQGSAATANQWPFNSVHGKREQHTQHS
jgi:hypothetical protein